MPLLYMDDRFLEHETGDGPESPERLRVVHQRLRDTGLIEQFERPTWKPATSDDLELVHRPEYVERIQAFARQGGGWLDKDTHVSERSFDVACLGVGAVVHAVDRVMSGPHRRAMCLIRPPGHHALAAQTMGFCLFNNVAIGAAHARQYYYLNRILIVDWDVHHGNGTQRIFYRDQYVYFLSMHRWPFYPGTGAADETGEGAGLGTICNLPIEIGTPREEILSRFQSTLQTVASKCRPELVLISAGFDAHQADPIGSLGLETEDFATMTSLVCDVAKEHADGRVVSVLEGGYNPTALADSVQGHLETLLKD